MKVNKVEVAIKHLINVFNKVYDYSAEWYDLPISNEERKPRQGPQYATVMVMAIKMTESLSSELDFQKIENTCAGVIALL